MLKNRSLLVLAIAPLAISLSLLVFGLVYFFSNMAVWVNGAVLYFLGSPDSWWFAWLYWPTLIVAGALMSVAATYLAYVVQSIVAIPFYAVLSERVLLKLGSKTQTQLKMGEWVRFNLQMVRVGLVKSFLFLILAVLLFGASFIPGLGFVSMFGALLIMSFDCMDYSFEAMGWRFRERLSYQRRNGRQWLGAATGLGLTLLVPGLTLLVIPGAVVGGAILIHESRSST